MLELAETRDLADFFISYTEVDKPWADWIAWGFETAGYEVIYAPWDFRPGHNFVLKMQQAASAAQRMIAILTPSYLEALFTQPEWAAALTRDPTGKERTIIPVRVTPCAPTGLLSSIVYIDLVGIADEHEAFLKLLDGIRTGRGKPAARPPFPSGIPKT